LNSAFDLTGRTAIITGSSTGNGRAIAISLAQAGADSEQEMLCI
jgi:NAD(P)-dependent dehydrogenase (short-subunit alcohol dehydrogenase family)